MPSPDTVNGEWVLFIYSIVFVDSSNFLLMNFPLHTLEGCQFLSSEWENTQYIDLSDYWIPHSISWVTPSEQWWNIMLNEYFSLSKTLQCHFQLIKKCCLKADPSNLRHHATITHLTWVSSTVQAIRDRAGWQVRTSIAAQSRSPPHHRGFGEWSYAEIWLWLDVEINKRGYGRKLAVQLTRPKTPIIIIIITTQFRW